MWQVLLQLLAVVCLISEYTSTPAIKPQSQRGIIFPSDNQDECFIDEQRKIRGVCKKLSECATALERWELEDVRPQTCYFNKFDHIVCCEMDKAPIIEPVTQPPPANVKRRSEMECEKPVFFKVAVVHGDPTIPNEFPYMAALGWESNFDNSTVYRCGGVLISDTFVLTAAHCINMGGECPITVRIGGVNLTEADSNSNNVKIKQIIVHPGYNASSSYHDIALIEMEHPVSERPACVWSQHDTDHNNVTAIGYGHIKFGGPGSDQLLKAPLFLVTNDICEKFYAPDQRLLQMGIARTHICAEDPEHLRDTCQGDSGGPIMMKVERDELRNYVVGITSLGQGCGGRQPSIYTRTSSYIDWIEDNVWPVDDIDLRKNKRGATT